ncbi:MAG TPA: phosphatase PAP2 family protein [Bacteroidetes bacterium]|nr:phosphatase PAP2 family protein [Bacteroidota bacterium]
MNTKPNQSKTINLTNNAVLTILLFFVVNINLSSQDSTAHPIYKKVLFPSALIASGIILTDSKTEQRIQNNVLEITGNSFHNPIDDYLQFVPIVELYVADALKVKAKNHWFDQSKYLFISNLLSTGISQVIKRTVLKIRPDNSPYSFPSGHTTIAFTNATVLYNEFKETSPILAYSGFIFSGTTGVFRVLNNRHWVSDVLTGAGLGILVTELVYYFEPLKNFNPLKNTNKITLIPHINNQNYSIYFVYSF